MNQLYKTLSDSVQPISETSIEVLTLCPCPPETLDCAVKSDLSKVDGGIPLCPFCGSTFYRDDLGSCYDCFFPSDDRGE